MTNPKRQKVTKSAKKAELLDRTISERKFCSVCQYYYSEMFTCPICYGAELERDRIHKAIYDYFRLFDGASNRTHKISEAELITLIKEAQDD
jgi:hypothetical protein